MTDKTINIYHNRINGVNFGFVIHLFLLSNIKTFERKLIYFFYAIKIIKHDAIKYEIDTLTKPYLLELIFKLAGNKKLTSKQSIRKITGLKDRKTFNKYFQKFLKDNNLERKRSFTLEETYLILNHWQGEHRWSRFWAYKKRELTQLMNKSYDDLQFEMTNTIIDYKDYAHHNYIAPKHVKLLAKISIKENEIPNLIIEKEHFITGYLDFSFYAWLFDMLISNYLKD